MTDRQIDTSCAIKRTTVEALESILGHAYPVLDHGFVRVIDYMGDDAAIAQMARTSYAQGTKSISDDTALIRYLMNHWHTSPFEGCEIKLHVKMPIFVARQWIRHRTANPNEMSGRYSILPGEFYFPEADRLLKQSKTNKQGTSDEGYSEDEAAILLDWMERICGEAYSHYEVMINPGDQGGYDMAREQARMILPVNIYTEMYWKIDLHNLFHFLRLRADSHAQYEIRVYADLICDLVNRWVPEAFRAWVDYRRDAVTFSRMEMGALREFVHSGTIPKIEGASVREATEFLTKLGIAK